MHVEGRAGSGAARGRRGIVRAAPPRTSRPGAVARAATASRRPHPYGGSGSHGIGARQPSRPPGSTTAIRGHHGVLEAELLAGVEERRAPQRRAAAPRRPGPAPRRRSGCGAAGLSWFDEHPRRPRAAGLELARRRRSIRAPPRRGVPRREQRREVERQVQLVAVAVVRRDPRGVEQEHLAHRHPVAGVAVEQAPDAAEQLVGRRRRR